MSLCSVISAAVINAAGCEYGTESTEVVHIFKYVRGTA